MRQSCWYLSLAAGQISDIELLAPFSRSSLPGPNLGFDSVTASAAVSEFRGQTALQTGKRDPESERPFSPKCGPDGLLGRTDDEEEAGYRDLKQAVLLFI
jgi:hypothetical protein